jgi:hypothetical protein
MEANIFFPSIPAWYLRALFTLGALGTETQTGTMLGHSESLHTFEGPIA